MDGIKMKEWIQTLEAVMNERWRQHEKWGEQNHAPAAWATLIGEEYGELCEAINETVLKNADKPERGGIDRMRAEAVQLAALSMQFIEYIERNFPQEDKPTLEELTDGITPENRHEEFK